MKNKRGVSPLLATVLLVAFSIALAVIVSNYVIKQTKEFNPEKIAEQSVFCESTNLGYTVENDNKENFGLHSESGATKLGILTLINRGAFSIHQLIISSPGTPSRTIPIYEGITVSKIEPGLNNKYDISINVNPDNINKEISIVPVINDSEKNQFVRCPDRKLIIDYEKLCSEINPSGGEGESACIII